MHDSHRCANAPAMRPALTALTLIALAGAVGAAQAPPSAAPRFDVVSVKPNKEAVASGGSRTQPGRLTFTAGFLHEFITNAHQTNDRRLDRSQIVAPEWVSQERFDITATFAPNATRDEVQAMMQSLLRERFAMRSHFETRRLRAYVLSKVRADGRLGPQLRASTVDCTVDRCFERNQPRGTYSARGMTWPATILLGELRFALDSRIVDRTGLTGRFDIDLEWSDPTAPANVDPAAQIDRPSLFTALQDQLGLDLQAGEEEVPVLVIDSIERPTPD